MLNIQLSEKLVFLNTCLHQKLLFRKKEVALEDASEILDFCLSVLSESQKYQLLEIICSEYGELKDLGTCEDCGDSNYTYTVSFSSFEETKRLLDEEA